jgi:xanthine dehydrogenase accessory factor
MTWHPAWLAAALQAADAATPAVLVTVAEAKGSTPREAGVKMLVEPSGIVGSVGGGQLELLAIDAARRLMQETSSKPMLVHHALGPDLGQCCGGAVRLLLEPLGRRDRGWLEAWQRCAGQAKPVILATYQDGRKVWTAELANRSASWVEDFDSGWRVVEVVRRAVRPLWLYGAGHVGRALTTVLAELDFDIAWLDSRPDGFPAQVPAAVRAMVAPRLASTVEEAPASCLFLVMTHSHQLDLEICDRILRRGDSAFLGVIGSDTKKARFLSGLKALGHGPTALSRLVCPIGLAQIPGKQPMAIAVAVAAQLLALPAQGVLEMRDTHSVTHGAG